MILGWFPTGTPTYTYLLLRQRYPHAQLVSCLQWDLPDLLQDRFHKVHTNPILVP